MRKISLRWQLFILFCSILLITSLLSGVFLHEKYVKSAVEQKLTAKQTSVEQHAQHILNVYQTLTEKILSFGSDRQLYKQIDTYSPEQQAEKMRLFNQLSAFRQSAVYIDSFYLLREEDGQLKSILDSELNFITGQFESRWLEMYEQSDFFVDSFPVRKVQDNSGERLVTSVVLRLPFDSMKKTAMLLINIDVQKLMQATTDLEDMPLFLGEDGLDWFSGGRRIETASWRSNLFAEPGGQKPLFVQQDGEQLVAFSARLPAFEGSYVELANEKELFRTEQVLEKTIFAVVGALLLLCTALSYLLSMYASRPIQKWLDSLHMLLFSDTHTNKPGLEEVRHTIMELVSENSQLQQTYELLSPLMVERFYLSLLEKKYASLSEIEEHAALLSLEIGEGPYGVICMEHDHYAQMPAERRHMMPLILFRLCHELILTEYKGFTVEIADNRRVLVLYSDSEMDERTFNQKAFHLSTLLQKQFGRETDGATLSFGIGRCGQLLDLPDLVSQTADLFKYKLWLGSAMMMNISDDEGAADKTAVRRIDTSFEDKLVNLLKTFQNDEFIAFIHHDLDRHAVHSYEEFREHIFQLLHVMLNVMERCKMDREHSSRHLYGELIVLKSYEEVVDWFMALAARMAQQNRSQTAQEENRWLSRILEALHSMYDNHNFSLQALSSEVNLSPTYIGRLLKKEKGVTIMEYVNELRLDKARELLGCPELKVGEIAGRAGFQTTHYFIKLFKERYGVTPGDYRKAGFS